MRQRIQVTEEGIADLWRIPVVQGIVKKSDGRMLVGLGLDSLERLANEGDWICLNENGTWSVEKGSG